MESRSRPETSSSASRIFPGRRANNFEGNNGEKGALGLTTIYEPRLTAIADLIFVHGLKGGSRSSWSKNNDPNLFWPQEWLPTDPKFEDVRIHTFGYNSKFSTDSVKLDIYDFARSLLMEIYHCPLIPSDSDVCRPIRYPELELQLTFTRFQLSSSAIAWEGLLPNEPLFLRAFLTSKLDSLPLPKE